MAMNLRTLLIGVSVMIGAAVGCDQNDTATRTDTTPTTAPSAGGRVAGAMDRTGDVLDRAADRTGQVVGRAVDEGAEHAREAGTEIRAGARELAAEFAEGIHDVLGDVTEEAMSQGEFDDLIDKLSQSDRARMGTINDDAFPELNREVAQFRQLWQSKYGRDFDIEDDRAVFSFVTIQGNEADADRATVIFPARGGMPELSVPMVREAGGWRIDVPDSITAQQIADNLVSGLRPINAGNPPLPDDITEACRSSAQGTMAALMGEKRTP